MIACGANQSQPGCRQVSPAIAGLALIRNGLPFIIKLKLRLERRSGIFAPTKTESSAAASSESQWVLKYIIVRIHAVN